MGKYLGFSHSAISCCPGESVQDPDYIFMCVCVQMCICVHDLASGSPVIMRTGDMILTATGAAVVMPTVTTIIVMLQAWLDTLINNCQCSSMARDHGAAFAANWFVLSLPISDAIRYLDNKTTLLFKHNDMWYGIFFYFVMTLLVMRVANESTSKIASLACMEGFKG